MNISDNDNSEENWNSFLKNVRKETEKLDLHGAGIPYFRGHYNSSWKLQPLIFRKKLSLSRVFNLENLLAFDFHTLCGQLYPIQLDDWEMSFEMRHAGLPTRLLDWSESFANALFFAINDPQASSHTEEFKPCIWILDPYELNSKTYHEYTIPDWASLGFDYHAEYRKEWDNHRRKFKGPIALNPPKSYGRMVAQKSLFTVHFSETPLEKFYKSSVTKIDIPIECMNHAKKFLYLSGVNDFTLFPDLDGLGKLLSKRYDYYINIKQINDS